MSDTSAMLGDLLIVVRHAPQGSTWVREALELALVGGSLGQRVGVLFQGDGVLALLRGQQPGPLNQKSTLPMIDVLEMYDIGPVWVDEASMHRYRLTSDRLAIDAVPTVTSKLLPRFIQCYLF